MALEYLCLADDGNAGRLRGNIIDVKECGETEKGHWGRLEDPSTAGKQKRFFIVREAFASLKTVDPKKLEFGGHKSRIVIKTSLLPFSARASIAADKPATVTQLSLSPALEDKGKDWETSLVAIGP